MTRIRLLTAYRGYKAGTVVELPPRVAAVLVAEGRAAEERQTEIAGIRRAEAAVASPAWTRTATAAN